MDPAPANAVVKYFEAASPALFIILFGLWFVWFVMWLILPFIIYGMSQRSKEQLAAQHETNRLLRVLTQDASGRHAESEATRNPFK